MSRAVTPTGHTSWTTLHNNLFPLQTRPGAGNLLLNTYLPHETPENRENARIAFRQYAQHLSRLGAELMGDVEKSPTSPKSPDEEEDGDLAL